MTVLEFVAGGRIAAFIDGGNTFTTARALGFDIDWAKVLFWLSSKGQVLRPYYYIPEVTRQDLSIRIRPLLDFLAWNGYTVVTKPGVMIPGESGGKDRVKGDMKVEIAVDMIELSPNLNQIFLFSGDGDLRRAVEAVQRKGLRVTVISSIKLDPQPIADDLRKQADEFVDLFDLKDIIQRQRDPE